MSFYLFISKIYPVGESDDFHIFRDCRAAGHDGFLLVAGLEPDLAIEAFSVPAKISVRNIFHCEKLKTPQQRIAFRDHVFCAENFDLDEFVVRRKNIWFGHDRMGGKDRAERPHLR